MQFYVQILKKRSEREGIEPPKMVLKTNVLPLNYPSFLLIRLKAWFK